MEFIGTGIVYDKESNTMELLKRALKLSGINFGNGILVMKQMSVWPPECIQYNSTFENQLTLTHTDDAGYIDTDYKNRSWWDFEQYT
jgi:hypothetical protein